MDRHITESGHEWGDSSSRSQQQDEAMRPRPDGGLDPMGEAGWFLQREREGRGETLEEIGDRIGIHPFHLEAIEYGDMTRMPERLEALEMISAYAQYLGFDPEPLVLHYVAYLPQPGLAPESHHPADPAPLSSAKILQFGRLPKIPKLNFDLYKIPGLSRFPGGAGGVLASIFGAALLFTGSSWMMEPSAVDGRPQVAEQQPAPDPMPTATTGQDMASVAVTEEKLADDQTAAIGEAPPAPAADKEEVDGLGAFIAQQVPEAPVKASAAPKPVQQTMAALNDDATQTATGTVYGASNTKARVVLKAKGSVWIRVEDAQGNVLVSRQFSKGDSYNVPDKPGLMAIARDGGLVLFSVDGKDRGSLGTAGEILTGRVLDPDKLKG